MNGHNQVFVLQLYILRYKQGENCLVMMHLSDVAGFICLMV